MADIKHMDIKEFEELGFLQEANRQFFHPLGLALELTEEAKCSVCDFDREDWLVAEAMNEILPKCSICETDEYPKRRAWLSGVWDYRDDSEGIVFGTPPYGKNLEKFTNVYDECEKHREVRIKLFELDRDTLVPGAFIVEPLDWIKNK